MFNISMDVGIFKLLSINVNTRYDTYDNIVRLYHFLNNNDIYKFFYDYNTLNPNNKIVESKEVSYCLLVKH